MPSVDVPNVVTLLTEFMSTGASGEDFQSDLTDLLVRIVRTKRDLEIDTNAFWQRKGIQNGSKKGPRQGA